jgi:hypothetical protein
MDQGQELPNYYQPVVETRNQEAGAGGKPHFV